jgi:mono/diheme cytochrome c family protein
MTSHLSAHRTDRLPASTRSLLTVFVTISVALGACDNADLTLEPERAMSAGAALFTSEGCVNCHGANGQGLIGPPLHDGAILETFGSCDDQLRWLSLGSAGWLKQVGASYGDTNKPVTGGMPGFGSRLDRAEILELATFTRSAFGGVDPSDVVEDCVD